MRIAVTAETSAAPEQVLALAGTDFSARRAEIWPNVTLKRYEVHGIGDSWAEVTEGGTGPARFAWERSRYEWSGPGRVTQTVIASNVIEPGSTWELRVAPREGGGSEVHMTLERHFTRSPAGHVASILNHVFGRRGWASMLRGVLERVERAAVPSGA